MWESESESVDYGGGAPTNSKHGVQNDGFEQRGQSWFVSTDIVSDFLVHIGDVSFHLHKYPLLSRSAKINRIIYESRDVEVNKISINDLPGGAEAFELAAKFCYGISVDLTAANISGLRCAAEYLEMTEDLEEGNLIFKTEAFLSYVVLSSWRDSIVVLKSCENLSPWAENLQIVRRCSESIAWKACANPKGIRWQYTGKAPRSATSPKWNEKDSSPSRSVVPPDWWFEDVSILRIDHFVRVITAIKVKGMRYELIGAVIMHYASKWLQGLIKEADGSASCDEMEKISSISNGWKGGLHMILSGNQETLSTFEAKDQRMIVESLISIIPQQRDCVSCSFLLRLLRMANMLKVAQALVTELEKRVGMQFEQALLADLLIPCYGKKETTYDVDLVQRLLEHFLVQEQSEGSSPSRHSSTDGVQRERGANPNAKMRVARLLDSYLTEVARDRNLSLTKFQVLAEALPESARSCDDGLYRAIDSYLKAHPTLSEHERKRLCRVMDCQKLSIDACMHAAQNERLPLRVVVQVLFSEQVKISNALANNQSQYQPLVSNRKTILEETPQSFQEGWAAAKKDINSLKFEVESVRAKYLELQHEMEAMQAEFSKMAKPSKQTSGWASGWKKLGKLTKMVDNSQHGGEGTNAGEQSRKTPRRWRNSIS